MQVAHYPRRMLALHCPLVQSRAGVFLFSPPQSREIRNQTDLAGEVTMLLGLLIGVPKHALVSLNTIQVSFPNGIVLHVIEAHGGKMCPTRK